MFASLDSIDIVATPTQGGQKQYIQTDHRTAAEIEQEPDLSILFALIRILNAKQMAEADSSESVVIYSAREQPPEFLQRVIHAAGAQLEVGNVPQPAPEQGEPLVLEEVAASAFANLAREVATTYGVSMTREGLAVVEQALAELVGDPEENAVAFGSAVVKLGSFGGEVIRAFNGGQWVVSELSTPPLALMTRVQDREVIINTLGKAIKRLKNGEEDTLTVFIDWIRSQT